MTLLVVLTLLFFSFHLSVRQSNAQAHATYFSQAALSLAQGGVNLGYRALREGLEARGSPLWRHLVEAAPGGLVGYEFPLELSGEVAGLTAGLGDDLDLAVRARVLESKPFVAGDGVDPLEQDLLVEVRATAEFRGLPRVVAETRRMRVLLDSLPVLGRFSLYVRAPPPDRPGARGYNRFANDINGRVDYQTVPYRENYPPVVLFNHGDTFPALAHDLEANGWVYLGGRDPVQLNLTSGADYRYGEYFHFYNFLSAETSRQAGFLAADPPAFFRRPRPVAGLEHRYFLKHVIYGYFTVDRGTPPSAMNRDGLLEPEFAAGETMRSSSLHLFGSTLSPSPTRVFGPVYQSYPIYTGITVDVDGDGRRDGLVGLVPATDRAGYEALESTRPIPRTVPDIGRPGGSILLDPARGGWREMFPSYREYEAHMSTVVRREPYNAGVDYLFSRGEFPPETRALDPAADYPNLGDAVTLRPRDGGAPPPHFSGDLADVDPALWRERAVLRVRDQAEFEARFLWPGPTLRLGHPVLVESGELALPPALTVARGGLLMTEGDLRFDGIRCAPGERLSLVSLGGDITSPFDHAGPDRPVEADLVALDGRVRVTDRNHPLAVFGTVAADRFAPEDAPSGGRLVYDPRADPLHPDRRTRIGVHLDERVRGWEL